MAIDDMSDTMHDRYMELKNREMDGSLDDVGKQELAQIRSDYGLE